MSSKLRFFIIIDSNTSLLGSIINKSKYMVVIIIKEFSQEKLPYIINESY